MEKATSGDSSRLLGILPRIGTIVLAVILIGVSAGTIGIISSNDETLQSVRTSDGLSESSAELLDLVNRSLSSAGWLIVLGVGVLVAETVAIILAVVLSPRLVLQVIDIIFSFVVAFFYGATGIACAAYAAEWGGPPPRCEGDDSDCDDVALTATIALSTVFSFIQAALFGFIAFFVIYIIMKSRKA